MILFEISLWFSRHVYPSTSAHRMWVVWALLARAKCASGRSSRWTARYHRGCTWCAYALRRSAQ